jgi:CelD/BcsL family acetyltransferase involved in cellulose biosynthesis
MCQVILVSYHVNLNEVQGDPAVAALLQAPMATAPFDRLAWFQGLVADCGLRPLLAVARDGDTVAILPLAQGADGLVPLANWYSFRVQPVFSPGADNVALLTAIARDLSKRTGRITLWPVPDGAASALTTAFRAAGWFVTREACDTNHTLTVGGRCYADYLATRPGPLRTTLKRKAKKVAITLYDHFTPEAWGHYETVYAASWKPEEGSPVFLRRFAEAEGAAGRLRLGVAHGDVDGLLQPVAAQLWTVEAGTAFIHKLAYVEAAKPLSPGTSLSAALFEQVIDRDGVTNIDFGTGDDPYKRDWMEAQRIRYRIVMLRPTAPRQWPAIARNLAKRLVRGGSGG